MDGKILEGGGVDKGSEAQPELVVVGENGVFLAQGKSSNAARAFGRDADFGGATWGL
jgi:hypothetical protein